jgi:outer membrane protein
MYKSMRALIALVITTFTAGYLSVAPVYAQDYNWIVRTGVTHVNPDAESNALGIDIEDDTSVSLDITRFLTPNLALNLVAVFTSHEVTSPACGGSCGNFDLLPPILTAQWHFLPEGRIRPYASAGINYNIFSNETGTLDAINTDIDNTFGYVLGAGVDVGLTETLAVNLDVKKIFLEADVSTDIGNDKFDVDPWVVGANLAFRF